MRIGLVVDAACDLPGDFLADKGIHVLPIGLRVGDRHLVDTRDPVSTAAFYRERQDRRAELHAESAPLSAGEIEALFLESWVSTYDHLVCMTITSGRSPIFAHATQAALTAGRSAREVRRAAGLSLSWGATVINSRTLFAGQGVLAYEAVRLRDAGTALDAMSPRLSHVADGLHAFMVADDLYYIMRRAAKKGDHSVNWAAYTVGSLLNLKPVLYAHRDNTRPVDKVRGFESGVKSLFARVERQIVQGLDVPCICVSYGGPVDRVGAMPGFEPMEKAAHAAGVEVLVSHMSQTAAINVGAGALCVAFAAHGHQV
ncbi:MULTISPECIES: DegV family protein [Denitromonas]|uniref:DegV family EDD domain-containing protein n=2 Tax=Denitromonas TaxID=139331 RepID=A0A557QXU9_9RHOO|nr:MULTISPECIES: DegV family protein [Denitromonas]TVO57666.1 DegV family EDD domain-containing protein [Denitromonas halophila]TVO68059.1 DegV family EDD domain-containing protein [Denitromonas ohlonensis]TVO78036.1 DegV family EDD domain-containing protein [Denitromonas ohlonensis]